MNRRTFLRAGGAWMAAGVLAGGGVAAGGVKGAAPGANPVPGAPAGGGASAGALKSYIGQYRTLGRTGFRVSDISFGGVPRETAVARYAYKRGVNYFDTAEALNEGGGERKVGDFVARAERKKIFVTTKLSIAEDDTARSILQRFGRCRHRLKADYVDALLMRAVSDRRLLDHAGFHEAARVLMAEGKLLYIGVSSHGEDGRGGDTMADVLGRAADDGRFALVMFVYNFMNHEAGGRVVDACKRKNVGCVAMKTAPGVLEMEPFDPERLDGRYAFYVDGLVRNGIPKEEALARLKTWAEGEASRVEQSRAFAKLHGAGTPDELRKASIQWVLGNPEVDSVCLTLTDYADVDRLVPISAAHLALSGA